MSSDDKANLELVHQEQDREYVDERRASAATGIPRKTWQYWRQVGSGPPYLKFTDKPKGRVLYHWPTVKRWLDAHVQVPRSPNPNVDLADQSQSVSAVTNSPHASRIGSRVRYHLATAQIWRSD